MKRAVIGQVGGAVKEQAEWKNRKVRSHAVEQAVEDTQLRKAGSIERHGGQEVGGRY